MKRDRRRTPKSTSLALGNQKSVDDFWSDAAPSDGVEIKSGTASVKDDDSIRVNKSSLNGEGTNVRIISEPKQKIKERKKRIRKARNSHRVPVVNSDGTPAMPTTNKRANKWLEEKKAKVVKNDLGLFQIQLLFEPSGRDKQDIVMSIDPGSAFTGVGVISKKSILYGSTLELPGYKKGSKPHIIKNRFNKKIQKYPNTIVESMTKRRELRRGRRYRKTRQRKCRFLNRSKSKISPSILSRKQLEYRVVKELIKIYPISGIGYEDINFNHFKDKYGSKGQFFSHVEVGKNWILDRLKWIVKKYNMCLGLRIISGYDTNIRRKRLGLRKTGDKTYRIPEAHITDCIAMGSIILDGNDIRLHKESIEIKNKYKFDVITRPKYDRRKLHLEKFSKGGFRRRYGGTTIPNSNLRKGDYVETFQGKKVFRGWVSGYIENDRKIYDKGIISVSGFDWNRLGQFGINNMKLLGRNTGLLLRSMEKEMTKSESNLLDRRQLNIYDAWD